MMRHRASFAVRCFWTLLALIALAVTTRQAHAQTLPFDGIDWTLDRGGGRVGTLFGTNASPVRHGRNNFNDPNNNPGRAYLRWLWPRTIDLPQTQDQVVVDNPAPGNPDANGVTTNNVQTNGFTDLTDIGPIKRGEGSGRIRPNSISHWSNVLNNGTDTVAGAWREKLIGNHGSSGGYSYVYTNPNDAGDFGAALAQHVDIPVVINGTSRSATLEELDQLPNANPVVYKGVQQVLRTLTPFAEWSIGTSRIPNPNVANRTLLRGGRYTVELYSPGDGTLIANNNILNNTPTTGHPNVTRAFVRVSYRNTVVAANDGNNGEAQAGSINRGTTDPMNPGDVVHGGGGTDDPNNSRIYLVNLAQSGWIQLESPDAGTASFPFDGTVQNQIVVTLYNATPESVAADNNPYLYPPVVTADAVRFTAQTDSFLDDTTNPATVVSLYDKNRGYQQFANQVLFPTAYPVTQTITSFANSLTQISGTGRILCPVVGTNKIPALVDPQGNATGPLSFVARAEIVANTGGTSVLTDPTDPNSPSIPDVTNVITAPVFYCLNNQTYGQGGVNNINNAGYAGVNDIYNSFSRVRWRYVGQSEGGSGTTVASPLIHNVRFRDGQSRAVVYFVTSSLVNDRAGHIYAFDPVGDTATHTTTTYWTYPSLRPGLTGDPAGTVAPTTNATLVPFNDPNYSLPTSLLTGRQTGTAGYPDPNQFPDTPTGSLAGKYYDGDIVHSTATTYQVRSDTDVVNGGVLFEGMRSSPLIVPDPNGNGADLLILGNQNGRVYAFDAGGRLDFRYDRATDPLNVVNIAGTTQRVWTWPILGADTFHSVHPIANNAGNDAGAGNIVGTANTFLDATGHGGYVASPAFDPNGPTYGAVPNTSLGGQAVVIGDTEGRLHGLSYLRDDFRGVLANRGVYTARETWTFPRTEQLLDGPVSTAALYAPNGGRTAAYITSGGRAYSVAIPTQATGSSYPLQTGLNWAFPPVPNLNNPTGSDPEDGALQPLSPGFNASAPLLLPSGDIISPLDPAVDQDRCYVLDGAGTLYSLNAGDGGVRGVTDNPISTFARSSPIAVSVLSDPTQYADANGIPVSVTAVVVADDNGNILGYKAVDQADALVGRFLPVVWGAVDAAGARSAAASLVNGLIVEGDETGQLHAYSPDSGTGVPSNQIPNGPNKAADASIDVRYVDAYSRTDWLKFDEKLAATSALTAAKGFGKSATPSPNVPFLDRGDIPADYGGKVYVAAAGVYHAVDGAGQRFVGEVPDIQVVFTFQFPNGRSYAVPGAVVARPLDGIQPKNPLWYDDHALSQAEHDNLSIYGIDPNDTMTTNAQQLTGPSRDVYPYIAYVGIPIDPDTNKPFAPGGAGYSVTAKATINQTVLDTSNNTTATFSDTDSLQLGASNPTGKTGPSNGSLLPGNLNSTDRRNSRNIVITNPLSITVSGLNGNVDQTQNGADARLSNIIGWAGPVDNYASIANVRELFGQGNQLGARNRPRVGNNGRLASTIGPRRALFAPVGAAQDGSSITYYAKDRVSTAGQPAQNVPAFYIADRTAYSHNGRALQAYATVPAVRFGGDFSSVMNPLPWEQWPTPQRAFPGQPATAQSTPDYPAIPASNVQMEIGNGDLTQGAISLAKPVPGNTYPDNPADRTTSPTQVTLTIKVPRYQPASMNFGEALSTGAGVSYGSVYQDLSGRLRGVLNPADPTNDGPVLGPMYAANAISTVNGLRHPANGINANNPDVFAAAGYVSAARITVRFGTPNGTPTGAAIGSDTQLPYRNVEMGLSVLPRLAIQVTDSAVDLGQLPAGTGYSNPITPPTSANGNSLLAPYMSIPFAPSGVGPYGANDTGADQGFFTGTLTPPQRRDSSGNLLPGLLSPWDDPNGIGVFFHPFTVTNESNVNLVSPRVAKLFGGVGTAGTLSYDSLIANPPTTIAAAGRLDSPQVNSLLLAPLVTLPYNGNGPSNATASVGNLGLVTSFDNLNSSSSLYNEHPLWPVYNPNIDDVMALQTTDPQLLKPFLRQTNNANLAWKAGLQPYPTIHKPRPGDGQGTTASIPDVPHDFTSGSTFTGNTPSNYAPDPPKIGLAVPPGTPVGTYANNLLVYEDSLPLQWRDWLARTQPNAAVTNPAADNDGILNTGASFDNPFSRIPIEPYSDPALKVKATVVATRLTGAGLSTGTYPQVDTPGQAAGYSYGANQTPTAISLITGNAGRDRSMFLYWATQRQPQNGAYSVVNGIDPVPGAPFSLAYTALNTPYQILPTASGAPIPLVPDYQFGYLPNPNTAGDAKSHQWGLGNQILSLFPGYDNNGQPLGYTSLFPSTPAAAAAQYGANSPFLPGIPAPSTVRYTNPAATSDIIVNGAQLNNNGADAYLFWQGSVDKAQQANYPQQTETRTFYGQIGNGNKGQIPTNVQSFLNDPALTKSSPKPLLITLGAGGNAPAQRFLFLFFHSGNQGSTSLYYNVNQDTGAGFTPAGWTTGQGYGDVKLPTPAALTWQSDPQPIYRRVYDPQSGNTLDAVDVAYTGVLKNRQVVEVLLSRYEIVRVAQPGYQPGQLRLMALPEVHLEEMTRIPGTLSTYGAKDAGWYLGKETDSQGFITVALQRGNQLASLNTRADGQPQLGRYDAASGLTYFDATSRNASLAFGGGQLVVDARSGTVTFPNIAPSRNDRVLVSYYPRVMRLNASRNQTNVNLDGYTNVNGGTAVGNLTLSDFRLPPSTQPVGDNLAPVVIMDRQVASRSIYQNPQVEFSVNGGSLPAGSAFSPIPRMWVLWRKTDIKTAGSKATSGLYYKTMRLTARLPRPIALAETTVNGNEVQKFTLTVTGNRGEYEVDWVRGRVYFGEADEGNPNVKIQYVYSNGRGQPTGNSGLLPYTIAWADEISTGGLNNGDNTTSESALPTSTVPTSNSVLEGQVSAIKDPFVDKLWVFWTSTISGRTDLFYEALAPQFYATASNQR